MTDREVMQQALRAFNLYLDWDGKDSSMLATFDIAANIVKDKLNAAIAQPVQQVPDAPIVMTWLDANCKRVAWTIEAATYEITDSEAFALASLFIIKQPKDKP